MIPPNQQNASENKQAIRKAKHSEDTSMLISTSDATFLKNVEDPAIPRKSDLRTSDFEREVSNQTDPNFEELFTQWCKDGSLEPIPLEEIFGDDMEIDIEFLESL